MLGPSGHISAWAMLCCTLMVHALWSSKLHRSWLHSHPPGCLSQWRSLCTLAKLAWHVCPAGYGSLDGEAKNVLLAMLSEIKLAHTKASQKSQPPPHAGQPFGPRQALQPQAATRNHRPAAAPTRGMSGKCCAAPVPAASLWVAGLPARAAWQEGAM